MKSKILSTMLVGTLCLSLSGCSKTLNIDSEKLNSTLITSNMEENVIKNKNIIYCSTFQLAWNELKETVIKDDVLVQGDPSMASYLNKSLSSKEDLSSKYYISMAGMKKDDIIKKINDELKSKFQSEAPIVDENLVRDDDIFAYAFLLKDLQFNKPFEDLNGDLNFKGTKVQCFGIKDYEAENYEIGEQVDIKDYMSDSDFIIGLKAKNSNDEIILGKVKPKANLLETYKEVESRIGKSSTRMLSSGDKLIIPKFDFNIKHNYKELVGRNLKNKGFENYTIVKAMQETRFKLDEKGVKLKSEAKLNAKMGIAKKIVFDKPFIFYMKEKGAEYPYFIMWVDNPEIILK